MRRLKQKLQNCLSLSTKILLRRLYADSKRSFVGVRERLVNSRSWPSVPALSDWKARNPSSFVEDLIRKRDAGRDAKGVIHTSVVIPVFNKVDFTFECLHSLLPEIDFHTTEVIIVNNASTDDTSEMLAHFRDLITVINNETNEGFVEASNRGAARARGDYLIFLNNDTTVLSGWLENLLETVKRDPRVGAVGSMFLYPDGSIQEAGAIVWRDGDALHHGWSKSSDDRKYNFKREVDYCSGASLLIRRELFERLDGFDRRYAPAYYEDVDLCFGVRSLGYTVVYQPLSRVIHYEGVTAGRDTAIGAKHYQIVNREKFYEKWRYVLERDQLEKDFSLAERASNRKHGPRFLVFDDRVPMPDRDAGSARMFQILKSLARLGHTVFLPVKPLREYEQLLLKEGIETADVVEYHRLIRRRGCDVAILSRPEVAEALVKLIRQADRKIKIVFDMVDAYFIRLHRQHKVTGDRALADESRRFEKLELQLAKESDQVWCNSSEDKKVVSQHIPVERIVVIPTIHELHDRGKSFAERKGLLFIGHLSHSPNSDAVHYFVREIFPLIKESLPSVIFYIVGSNASPEIEAYESDSVKVMGYVPDIDPLFHSARVFVAPLRFGAGVKGKIGESLSYGLPVVTTSIGAEGFGLTPRQNVLIADDASAFADSVLRLYNEPDLWQRLSNHGFQHIENNYTPPVIGRTIEEGLMSLGVIGRKDV